MSSNPPDRHESDRREIATAQAEADAAAAFEKLRPLLKPDKQGEAKLILTRTIRKTHSGPIPPAEEIEHLERVMAGAANRCFLLAEKEQDHRHEVDKDIIRKEFTFRARGQWCAMGTVVLLLLVVVYIASLGDTRAAAALGTATLVGLVGAWAAARWIESKEDQSAPEPEKKHPPAPQKGRKSR